MGGLVNGWILKAVGDSKAGCVSIFFYLQQLRITVPSNFPRYYSEKKL